MTSEVETRFLLEALLDEQERSHDLEQRLKVLSERGVNVHAGVQRLSLAELLDVREAFTSKLEEVNELILRRRLCATEKDAAATEIAIERGNLIRCAFRRIFSEVVDISTSSVESLYRSIKRLEKDGASFCSTWRALFNLTQGLAILQSEGTVRAFTRSPSFTPQWSAQYLRELQDAVVSFNLHGDFLLKVQLGDVQNMLRYETKLIALARFCQGRDRTFRCPNWSNVSDISQFKGIHTASRSCGRSLTPQKSGPRQRSEGSHSAVRKQVVPQVSRVSSEPAVSRTFLLHPVETSKTCSGLVVPPHAIVVKGPCSSSATTCRENDASDAENVQGVYRERCRVATVAFNSGDSGRGARRGTLPLHSPHTLS